MSKTEAWVLYRSEGKNGNALHDGTFRVETIDLPEMGDYDLLVEPIYCSWEANMSHALERDPVDVCKQRHEEKIVLGNTAIIRILKKGSKVPDKYAVGDVGYFWLSDHYSDKYGYMELAFAYDAPKTIGFLAKQNVVHHELFLHLPENQFTLQQWAAFGLKYATAYSNWKLTQNVYRLQVPAEQKPQMNVFAWGGGTALAQLELAHIDRHRTYMLTSHPGRMAYLESKGITAVDRTGLAGLAYEEEDSKELVRKYVRAYSTFRKLIKHVTDDAGVDVFIDYINAYPHSTRRIVNRQGIITTAGWKRITDYSVNRPTECIRRHIHIHTHYANYREVLESIDYAIEHNWMPDVDEREVFDWKDVDELARRHIDGEMQSFFPLYKVNNL